MSMPRSPHLNNLHSVSLVADCKLEEEQIMSQILRTLIALLLLATSVSACTPIQAPETIETPAVEAPENLLFLGNSFTYWNGGLENDVKDLAASATPPRELQADSYVVGGATSKILYKTNMAHSMISDGGYDVVILQGDIPELTEHSVEPFLEHARLFDQEIKDAGSDTVIFMAWPYERLNWVTLEEIVQAHREISAELGAPVAPVGVAFDRAMAERPELDMLSYDKEHESIHGTYLAANVIYATLFGESPEGFTYMPAGVSEEEAAFLQRIAWETVQEWQNQQ